MKEATIEEPRIMKLLDVSTTHITPADALELDLMSVTKDPELVVYTKLGPETRYGWFVPLCDGEQIKSARSAGMSDLFVEILLSAQELGCNWVQFDRDGTVYDGLPRGDWKGPDR